MITLMYSPKAMAKSTSPVMNLSLRLKVFDPIKSPVDIGLKIENPGGKCKAGCLEDRNV